MTPPARDLIWLPAYRPTPLQIIEQVARRNDLSSKDLRSDSRRRKVAYARQEAMWELRQRTTLSLPRIGYFFGRHHATVIYGLRKFEERLAALQEAA